MIETGPTSYGKIKVGIKSLNNATIALGSLAEANKNYGDKRIILKALAEQDVDKLREISNYFYRTSGIYQRACNYFATMYRYDWYIVPEVYETQPKEDKVIAEFSRILTYLDNSYVKKLCGEIALEVIKSGAYYGYITEANTSTIARSLLSHPL